MMRKQLIPYPQSNQLTTEDLKHVLRPSLHGYVDEILAEMNDPTNVKRAIINSLDEYQNSAFVKFKGHNPMRLLNLGLYITNRRQEQAQSPAN